MRNWGILASSSHGETDSFLAFNRNKLSVAADLRDASIRDLQLGARADVVVENFRPGVMDKLGLGFEDFRRVNSAIVYARSSGWGQSGPNRDWPGHDMLVQGVSGMMYLTGTASDPPIACGAPVVDTVSGLYLALGILAGVTHARSTGQGQIVEIDLLGCAFAAQQQELTVFLNRPDRAELPRPDSNIGHVGATAPYGIYETLDGYFGMAMFPDRTGEDPRASLVGRVRDQPTDVRAPRPDLQSVERFLPTAGARAVARPVAGGWRVVRSGAHLCRDGGGRARTAPRRLLGRQSRRRWPHVPYRRLAVHVLEDPRHGPPGALPRLGQDNDRYLGDPLETEG